MKYQLSYDSGKLVLGQDAIVPFAKCVMLTRAYI